MMAFLFLAFLLSFFALGCSVVGASGDIDRSQSAGFAYAVLLLGVSGCAFAAWFITQGVAHGL